MPEAISQQTAPTPPPPAGRYLRRFKIRNVRTFRSETTMDLCHSSGMPSQWTVILGENGTGKTTLLQYIAGMMPVYDETLRNRLEAEKKPAPPPVRPLLVGGDWFNWHAFNLPRPWRDPVQLEAASEVTPPVSSLQDVQANHSWGPPFGFKLTFGRSQEKTAQISAQFTVPSGLEYLKEFHLFGYGASRHVAGPASPYLTSSLFSAGTSPVATLFDDDEPLISPEQWLLGLDHISQSKGEPADAAKRTLQSACRCLAAALPDIDTIRVAPFGLLQGQTAMTVLCKTPYGEVPFGALGIGYRTMAAWLTDFLRRMYEAYPNNAEPNTLPAIVLIDEFDLHMHPRWQEDAMRALSKEFPNTQFIVTVHSPLVVRATEGTAKIVVLRSTKRDDGTKEVLIYSDPQYAAGWRVDQILASDLYGLGWRSEKYTHLIDRRVRLLQKESLTADEREELRLLNEQLDREAPPGVSSASKQLFEDLQKALRSAEDRKK